MGIRSVGQEVVDLYFIRKGRQNELALESIIQRVTTRVDTIATP